MTSPANSEELPELETRYLVVTVYDTGEHEIDDEIPFTGVDLMGMGEWLVGIGRMMEFGEYDDEDDLE